MFTIHRLDVPSTLNGTLTNTNIIENTIQNWREVTNTVKQWNEKTDMVARWAASGLLWAEAGYRRVRGYADLPQLAAALGTTQKLTRNLQLATTSFNDLRDIPQL